MQQEQQQQVVKQVATISFPKNLQGDLVKCKKEFLEYVADLKKSKSYEITKYMVDNWKEEKKSRYDYSDEDEDEEKEQPMPNNRRVWQLAFVADEMSEHEVRAILQGVLEGIHTPVNITRNNETEIWTPRKRIKLDPSVLPKYKSDGDDEEKEDVAPSNTIYAQFAPYNKLLTSYLCQVSPKDFDFFETKLLTTTTAPMQNVGTFCRAIANVGTKVQKKIEKGSILPIWGSIEERQILDQRIPFGINHVIDTNRQYGVIRMVEQVCNPNCELTTIMHTETNERMVVLHAMRDISPNEHLTCCLLDRAEVCDVVVPCTCTNDNCGLVVHAQDQKLINEMFSGLECTRDSNFKYGLKIRQNDGCPITVHDRLDVLRQCVRDQIIDHCSLAHASHVMVNDSIHLCSEEPRTKGEKCLQCDQKLLELGHWENMFEEECGSKMSQLRMFQMVGALLRKLEELVDPVTLYNMPTFVIFDSSFAAIAHVSFVMLQVWDTIAPKVLKRLQDKFPYLFVKQQETQEKKDEE